MNLWAAKKKQLRVLIDCRVQEDAKDYNMLGNMPALVNECSSVQFSKLMDMVASNPELGNVPEHHKPFATIYEIIEHNIRVQLLEYGNTYYASTYP